MDHAGWLREIQTWGPVPLRIALMEAMDLYPIEEALGIASRYKSSPGALQGLSEHGADSQPETAP